MTFLVNNHVHDRTAVLETSESASFVYDFWLPKNVWKK